MFQSKSYIESKHGKHGTDRGYYLTQLVQEYTTTEKQEAKQQVLANLANFAYDPINYNTLWDLHVVDLFLTAIKDKDPLLQEFGMGGLANICLDQRHYEHILSQPVFRRDIIRCLEPSYPVNTKINAMTLLMQLVTEENYKVLLTEELEKHLNRIREDSQEIQASMMATMFLTDFYYYTF